MDPKQLIKKLEDNRDLVDILIQVEDYLDSLDLYVFSGWQDLEVVAGPEIEKYWVKMTLKCDYKKMPDPKGGLRLLKHGCKIVFKKGKEQVPVKIDTQTLDRAINGQPRMKLVPIWLIDLKVPRRFVQTLSVGDFDLYGNDADDLQSAKDEGIDHESGLRPETVEPEVPEENPFA
jgi:hypothetical protein